MSNENFDLNEIVYANNYTKITLKSKQKLAEIAAQVAYWNSEKFSMSSNKENGSTHTPKQSYQTNHRKIFGSLNSSGSSDNSKNLSISQSNPRKSFMDVNGSVKTKAAFFEGLIKFNPNDKKSDFHVSNNKKFNKKLEFCNTSKFNIKKMSEEIPPINEDAPMFPVPAHDEVILENHEEEFDESLPPPPPPEFSELEHCSQLTESNYLPESDRSAVVQDTNDLSAANQSDSVHDSNGELSQDLTFVSSLESSTSVGSFYDEFVNEFAKLSQNKDTESLPGTTFTEQPQKIRRSLSFSDQIKYIEPSSEDDSSEIVVGDYPPCGRELNRSSNSNNIEQRSRVRNAAERDNLTVGELKQKSFLLIDELKEFSSSCQYKPGSVEHLKKCLNIVQNNLKYASVAESEYCRPVSGIEIVANIDLCNILLSVRDGFVLINYKSLIKRGFGGKLNRVSVLFHAVLMGRSTAGKVIYESDVYTFVKRNDADKLRIEYQDSKWLELFNRVSFSALRSGFKLIFELYTMKIHPNKSSSSNKGTPKSRTPMKKLFSDSPSQNIDCPIILTNVGTFRLGQLDLTTHDDAIEKTMILPQNCPFDGSVQMSESLSFTVTSKCEGRLSIYMEISGLGAWAFRDCAVSHTGLIGGKTSELTGEIEDIDVEIPFYTFKGSASLCDYHVCAKANAFSVLLIETDIKDKMPINRRLSTDGKRKCRFLAAAESREDAVRWCKWINSCQKSFLEWSEDIKLP